MQNINVENSRTRLRQNVVEIMNFCEQAAQQAEAEAAAGEQDLAAQCGDMGF
jgi:hypothetical protein